MRPPRFRLRTLMIVVAVAALECGLIVDSPLAGMFLLGPLIGSPLMGMLAHDSRGRHVVLLLGGIVGGMVEAGVIVVVSEGVGSPNTLMAGWGRDAYGTWLVANVITGFGVGLAFGTLYALRLAIVCPACIVEGSAIQVTDDLESDGGSVKGWSQPAVRRSAPLD